MNPKSQLVEIDVTTSRLRLAARREQRSCRLGPEQRLPSVKGPRVWLDMDQKELDDA